MKSDVLRVGHHGGKTSSNKEFLESVDPDYSVISLGKDNSYRHPHEETISRLHEIDTKIMRTDELGNIIIISDGKGLIIDKELVNETSDKAKENRNKDNQKYYIDNKNTKVFYSKDCGLLPKKNQIIFDSIKEAEDNSYERHKSCVN